MAKIPLRSYFREIESLVERGMNEEAAAHCRFILKYYPKSIDTYRLLSKAFLESQRYSEAADILQRILSVAPDDFFALIGMSITREDEGNLDAAIFYMERAYETQPANVAVQDELRRLYGRRDGVEPPKLRLSRGALVRMYYKGGLNRQAIAEINAALKEDPQRTDLEVILAKINMDLGEKIPAFEVASRILSKLPYCFDAIQILVNILPTTAHAEDTQKYVERLISLDPYFAFISSSCPTVQQVPDNAVIIDRLDWQASHSEAQQPAWAQTVGVSVEADHTDASPDWLTDISASAATAVEKAEPDLVDQPSDDVIPAVEPSQNNLPEWMQQAGWAVSDGVEAESQMATDSMEEEEATIEPTKAELPDWLKELAPDDVGLSEEGTPEDQAKIDLLEQILPPSPDPATEISPAVVELPIQSDDTFNESTDIAALPQETLDFLTALPALDQESVLPEESGEVIEPVAQTLSTVEGSQVVQSIEPTETAEEVIPDWIDSLATFQPEEIKPDSISGIESAQIQTEPEQVAEPQPVASEEISEELPDWLKEIAASQEIASSTDESLPGLSSGAGIEVLDGESSMAEQVQPVDGLSTSNESEPVIEEMPEVIAAAAAEEEEEAVGEPSSPPELIAIPPEDMEFQPVNEISPEVEEEPESVEPLTEISTVPVETGLPDFSDADAALAWLESLAAKQGAAEETLITPPEERLDTAPDWVQALASSEPAQQISAEIVEPVQTADQTTPEAPVPEEPAVENLSLAVPVSEITEPAVIEEKPVEPEVVAMIEEPVASEGVQQPQPPAEMDFDTAFAWLESLAAQQGAPEETLLTPAEERPANQPDHLQVVGEEEEATSPTQPIKIIAASPTETVEALPVETALPEEEVLLIPVIEEPDIEPSFAEKIAPEAEVQEAEDVSEETAIPSLTDEPKHTGQLAPLPVWLQDISSEPTPVAPKEQETSSSELPDWLKGLESVVESQPQAQPAIEALPEWLNDIEKAPAEPPAEEPEPEAEKAPEWIQGLADSEENKAAESAGTLTQEELQKFDELEAIPAGTETPQLLLNSAQSALTGGKIEISMRYYTRLIQNHTMVEETIHDLRDALYRFPVDISIWQTLGDAYLRNNQIQDALDAYTKAEEFLR